MTNEMTEKVPESWDDQYRGRRGSEGAAFESEARRHASAGRQEGTDGKWAAVAVAVVVLVPVAFATGWHFGRRWGRLMGW